MKGRQVCFLQVAFGCYGVEGVTLWLWTTMNCVMFGCGDDLQVFGVITLESFDESYSHSCSEIGILTVSLLATAPTRIAKDVDVWDSRRSDPCSDHDHPSDQTHYALHVPPSRSHRRL